MYRKQKIFFAVGVSLLLVFGLTHWFRVVAAHQLAQVCDVPGDFGTIQAAVDDLNCDTINVGNGIFTENVIIDRQVAISGLGILSTTVDGNASGSVFKIDSNGVVTLTDMTIINGLAGNGGGILILGGTATIVNSHLTRNSATFGGGIRNFGGRLSITNSNFISNTADNMGGGIINDSIVTITNSLFISNTADNGGGIYNLGDLSIDESDLLKNVASDGGAITNLNLLSLTNSDLTSNKGSGIKNYSTGKIFLNSSTLFNNESLYGGGIENSSGLITITYSTIISNSAFKGGGIANESSGDIIISNSTISNNSATFGGGISTDRGTLFLDKSTVNDNSADEIGGGIYENVDGNVGLMNSTVSGNSATISGGGIYLSGGSILTLTNSTLYENAAVDGGGIYNVGSVTVFNTIIANSIASDDCFGNPINSGGYNLDSDNTCNLVGVGDINNTDPLLGTLQNNGGSTFTHALLGNSPALNQISAGVNGCGISILTDQRGISRPQEIGCDIGSFELVITSTSDYTVHLPVILND